MILKYIDLLFPVITTITGLLSIVMFLVVFGIVTRNTGARLAVLRALTADPGVLRLITSQENVRKFLTTKVHEFKKVASYDEHQIIGTIDFLLTQEVRRFLSKNVHDMNYTLFGITREIDYHLFLPCIIGLREVMDQRQMFNPAVGAVSEAVMELNRSDLEQIKGVWNRVISWNWVGLIMGGRNTTAVTYFLRIFVRDAILDLTTKISEGGYSFKGAEATQASEIK